MYRISVWMIAAVVTVLASSAAMAAWTEVDTFQSFSVGQTINGVNGWQVVDFAGSNSGLNNAISSDPADGANKVLDVHGDADAENNDKAAAIADGNTGTLFFRFYVPTGNTPDLSIGVSGEAVPDNGSDLGPTFRINDTSAQVYDSAFQTVGTLARDTWYSVWVVVANNSGGDFFQAYIQGGEFTTQTKLYYGVDDDTFAFRNNPTGDFLMLDIRANGSHNGDSTLFDDIYIDATAENLTAVPEPASLALLACGGVATMLRRRR